MRRFASSFGALVVAGALLAACGSSTTPADETPTPTPTAGPGELTSVHPSDAFLGRSAEIIIAGDATEFDDSTTVDFGEGVTVDSIEVMGPSTLRVMVSTDPMGTAGARNLTVTTTAGSLTLDSALNLSSPIEVTLSDGTEQAGSINFYSITNLDTDNPFTEDIAFEVAQDAGAEVVGGGFMSAEEAMVVVYFDLYAEPKAVSVTTQHAGLTSYAADAFTATPTTIQTIDMATGFNPSLDAPGKIAAGRLDLVAGDVVSLDVTAAGDAPVIMLFNPTDGTFFDNKMFAPASGKIYLGAEVDGSWVIVLHDSQLLMGGAPTGDVVSAFTGESMGMVMETEPNDDMNNPQMLTQFPAPVLVQAEVNQAGDVDYFAGDLNSFGVDATYVRAVSMPAIQNGLALSDTYMRAYEDQVMVTENEDTNAYFAGLNTFLVGDTGYIELSSSPQYAPDDIGRHLVAIWAEAATLATDTEPNDDKANASSLGLAPAVTLGTVEGAGTLDYYTFTLSADQHVTLETGPSGANTLPAADTYMALYDDADQLVADNEDKSFFDYWSMLDLDLTAGTYYVTVQSSPDYAPDDTGDYRLTIVAE